MANIFLSYSSKDVSRIEPLVREFKARGWSVWWDRDLVVGPAYADKIQQELELADCVVVAWSEQSVASHWCRDEANVGLERNRLVPLLLDKVLPPLGFRSSHTADLTGWPDVGGEIDRLVCGIADCLKVAVPILATAEPYAANEEVLLVLPFANRSPNPDEDYFCDGLVEDITSALSQIPELTVLSRNTAFEFKQSKSPPGQIARWLGANFVLSGSVRRSGSRVRVSSFLQKTQSGETIWSQTFDRDLRNIFEVQDDLTRKIVTALDVELIHGDHARAAGYRHNSVKASRELYKGMFEYHRLEPASMEAARQHFERYIKLEPNSVVGYSWLTMTWAATLLLQWAPPKIAMLKIRKYSGMALAIDPKDVSALLGQSYFNIMRMDLEAALKSASRAVGVAPNSDEAVFIMGYVEMLMGQVDRSIINLERSIRLSPIPSSTRLGVTATAYRNAGRFDESIKIWKHLIYRFPDFIFGYSGLASTYAIAGQKAEALTAVSAVLRRDPSYSVRRFTTPDLYRDESIMRDIAAALLDAGMPLESCE